MFFQHYAAHSLCLREPVVSTGSASPFSWMSLDGIMIWPAARKPLSCQNIGRASNLITNSNLYITRLLIDGLTPLPEAMLFSDAGTSQSADMVQASRSIILHLNDGQVLTLEKTDTRNPKASPNTETDKRLTFCVSLKHLDAALELGKNIFCHNLPSNKVFPGSLPVPLVAPSISLEQWNYTAPILQDFAHVQDSEPLAQPLQAVLPDLKRLSSSRESTTEINVTNPV